MAHFFCSNFLGHLNFPCWLQVKHAISCISYACSYAYISLRSTSRCMDFLLLFMQQTFNDNSQKLLEILLFSSSNFPKKKKLCFLTLIVLLALLLLFVVLWKSIFQTILISTDRTGYIIFRTQCKTKAWDALFIIIKISRQWQQSVKPIASPFCHMFIKLALRTNISLYKAFTLLISAIDRMGCSIYTMRFPLLLYMKVWMTESIYAPKTLVYSPHRK